MNVLHATSSEGLGRCRYHEEVRHQLDSDREMLPVSSRKLRNYRTSTQTKAPKDSASLWGWLSDGALNRDVNAYRKSEGRLSNMSADSSNFGASAAIQASCRI
jgi:hypothetical protein